VASVTAIPQVRLMAYIQRGSIKRIKSICVSNFEYFWNYLRSRCIDQNVDHTDSVLCIYDKQINWYCTEHEIRKYIKDVANSLTDLAALTDLTE